jgi:regulatory protein
MAIRPTRPDRRRSATRTAATEGGARRPAGRSRRPADAQSAAVALLARRDYATGELSQRLQAKGYDREVIAALIQELRSRRVLDDVRYAENYVSFHSGRGEGPERIREDLLGLGLPAGLVDDALKAGPDWRELAREQRSRRFGPQVPESWPEKARQARFLQYRGFSSDHIRAALGADFDSDS